jgi:hypothetical protein
MTQLATALSTNSCVDLLDFSWNKQVTDASMATLAIALPQCGVRGVIFPKARGPQHYTHGRPIESWTISYANRKAIASLFRANHARRYGMEASTRQHRPYQRLLLAAIHAHAGHAGAAVEARTPFLSADLMLTVLEKLCESAACPFERAGYCK